MIDPHAPLDTLLSDYRHQLGHRMHVVDDLRREAGQLPAAATSQIRPLLDALGDNVRRSDDHARQLMAWIQSGRS